ncbi:5764_t:CDS:2 [Gigaspora margarita]|uniref:5764_t:CDS:1 n=1 Tax=Gigaspora margarita TaxID=4874 RepID=A0ABN7UVQ6_GIGMA|nr:5764_t:CDS:2 [Gigaspora margarita]
MFGIEITSYLPPDWAAFFNALSLADIIAGIPAFLVIYTVLPSAIYTARHRSSKGNWYIPPEPTDESPSMQAKLYFAQYIFGHPAPEIFVTGALLTVLLITVVIYHFENIGIVKPAIPLSVLWGTTTLTTLYYTTSTHDISHEIYLVSSLLMFMLEWAAPRNKHIAKDNNQNNQNRLSQESLNSETTVNHMKSE